jgi:hypothetical protein
MIDTSQTVSTQTEIHIHDPKTFRVACGATITGPTVEVIAEWSRTCPACVAAVKSTPVAGNVGLCGVLVNRRDVTPAPSDAPSWLPAEVAHAMEAAAARQPSVRAANAQRVAEIRAEEIRNAEVQP